MLYVIYNTKSTVIVVNPKNRNTHYKTLSAAKAAKTRLSKAGVLKANEDYSISESEYYVEKIEKYEDVENIMNPGHFVKESVNTPYYMSVGSEAYFSM